MSRIQQLLQKLISVLLLTLFLTMIAPLGASAQTSQSRNFLANTLNRVRALFNPPSTIGVPAGRSRGGAGRGEQCPPVNFPLTALVPDFGQLENSDPSAAADDGGTSTLVWGTTVEEFPTLWFYVPYLANNELGSAKFMLLNAERHPVHTEPIFVNLAETPGIVSVQLPFALVVGQSYNWFFSIVCDANKPSRNAGVRGWIQRIETSPQLTAAIAQSPAGRTYIAYGEQGIWYDTVTYLAKRKRDSENETVREDWIGLLSFMGLSHLVETEIVPCCTAIAPTDTSL